MRRRGLGTLVVAIAIAGACSKKSNESTKAPAPADEQPPAETAQPTKSPPQIIIDELSIEAVGDLHSDVEPYAEQLAQRFGRQLAGSGYFFALANETDPMREAKRAKIRVNIEVAKATAEDSGQAVLRAAVESTVQWSDENEPFLSERLLGERELADDADAALADVAVAHVVATCEETAKGLALKAGIYSLGEKELAKLLIEGDLLPDQRALAIRLAGERGNTAATATIIESLGHEHPMVRDAAITAAVALGDARAVAALTKSAELSDTASTLTIIEAVSRLGGDEAQQYLEFVATGHPDARVREAAAQHLK